MPSLTISFLHCSFGQLPAHIKLRYSTGDVDGSAASRKKKGKCKEGEEDLEYEKQKEALKDNRLATLDIFAGCGGLSEGLQHSGKLSLFFLLPWVFPAISEVSDIGMSVTKALHDLPFYASNNTGASVTKWAIEYEEPAGDAFKLNHPESVMFISNCNVILRYKSIPTPPPPLSLSLPTLLL